MNVKTWIMGLAGLIYPLMLTAQEKIDLAGKWQSTMGEVLLPGSLLTNDKGDELSIDTKWTGSLYDSSFYHNPYMAKYRVAGRMKFPFFLTPNKHYVGEVTYTKKVFVPKSWKKKRIILFLERPHIETTVTVNGRKVGHQMSLNTPHQYDVTEAVAYGKENDISVRVYNGIENVCVGQDSHSVTDQTQGNWNGIAGRMELQARGRDMIENVQVYPDIKQGRIKVVVRSKAREFGFLINGAKTKAIRENDSTFVIAVKHPRMWSEFDPYVYRLTVTSAYDRQETTFGMREISISGRQFYLNGKPIWIRGTVGNCTFPLTGYPPTDVESWEHIFRKCREYGLNMMRFHSYCPPEAAFVAADKVGIYLQPEGPSWPNHGVRLRRGMYIDTYLMDETQRMVEAYGNHPSFVMMAAGNEPAGDWVSWCNDWVDYWKKTDNRRVYCGASVGGGWAWDNGSEYHVKGGARGLDWDRKAPQSIDDYHNDIRLPRNFKPTDEQPENTEPYISHEQGQWCAFPDLKERSLYTGVYKAYNFDIFEDLLRDNGMLSQAGKFLYASGKLQTLAYKYEIERNLRTEGYAGFQMLSLNDYSGQGTALVGPLNVFWQEKGYVNGEQWREFCSELVPLVRFPKFVFESYESANVSVGVYNATGKMLTDASVTLDLETEDGKGSGWTRTSDRMVILPGKTDSLLVMPLRTNISGPTKMKARATIVAGDKKYTNSWDYWIYPKAKIEPKAADIYETDTLDTKVLKVLEKGGKVLITAAGKVRYGSDVKQTYLPVFWNTSWFKMRPPHTTGATIDTKHPLFKGFPTDDWANLNWWELLNRAQVMNLSQFPKDYQPCIQPIDTWHVSRKLGMMIEANVLNGKVLMTTMDISSNLDRRPVARQMRKAVVDYMQGNEFNPTMRLEPSVLTNLFENEAPAVNMFTKDSPDELKPKIN